jgi:hypothetical protein
LIMKKYSVCFLGVTIAILAVFVVFNWIVDPYWINGAPEIKRFNSIKPLALEYSRLYKIPNVLQHPPEVLILGSSREENGIDPRHPAFQGSSVFNAAMSAQPYVESKEILLNLAKHGDFPKTIVFGLFFERANAFGYPLPPDYAEENYDVLHKYKLLLSISTLTTSAITVAKNFSGGQPITEKNGFRTPDMWGEPLLVGHRKVFKENEKNYMFDQHFPIPACKSALVDDTQNRKTPTPMQELQESIAIAYRMKADMKLIIGPSHARQWETIQASGLWGQFEDWKRMVVQMVESEALKAQAAPFQVWDFSGYNSITEEDVPSDTEINKRMLYYFDSSHFTPVAGDLVINRIFNLTSPELSLPDDFGVLLSSQNIEAHIADIRLARERYRQSHQADIAEIEVIAREVAKKKHCANDVVIGK